MRSGPSAFVENTEGPRFGQLAWPAFSAGGLEDERVANVHHAAALRLGELDGAHRVRHTRLHTLVTHAAGAGALDDAHRRDLELGHHGAGQVLAGDQLALVAVPDGGQLAADVAADGVGVELAGRRRVADGDLGTLELGLAVHRAARARCAEAGAAGSGVADEAEVAGADEAAGS